jgi:hypothetical protein
MNRRHFLQMSLAASALSLIPATAAGSTPLASPFARPKRGLGMSVKNADWREKLRAVKASWFYSWSAVVPGGIPPGVEFVPMFFSRTSDDKIAEAAAGFKQHRCSHLLGLNEPDAKEQGNLSVEEALDLWPKFMELGLPLGSPGCVHPDKEWMQAFMRGVEERSLRVDFVCVHSYGGPSADALMRRLEAVRDLYQRPIWITEFGVGDWQAKTVEENRHSAARVQAFMQELLPRLDACDFVERYAWFPARPTSIPLGTSALFNPDGSLTRLGEIYASI